MTGSSRGRTLTGRPLTPGVNVDRVDVAAGLAMAHQLGYDSAHNDMVLAYALTRHARGEEEGAVKTARGEDGIGNDLTSWYAILAAAVASAEAAAEPVTRVARRIWQPGMDPADAVAAAEATFL